MLHQRRLAAHCGSASVTYTDSFFALRRCAAASAAARVPYRPTRTRYGADVPTTRASMPRAARLLRCDSADARVGYAPTCTVYFALPDADLARVEVVDDLVVVVVVAGAGGGGGAV